MLADDAANAIAVALGGELLGTHIAIGTRGGYRVRCRVIGSLTSANLGTPTEIEIELHGRRRLELWVIRGNPDREDVEFGDEIDVEVGQASFDEAFHVEGAPSDVLRALFDVELCGRLVALPDPVLSTANCADRRGTSLLRLCIASWEVEHVLAAVDVLLQIARNLEIAYEIADAALTHHGSPFRSEITPRARIDAARDLDFEKLHHARRSRTWWRQFRRALRRLTSRRRAARAE